MAANHPQAGQAPTDDVNMTDAQSDQPTQHQQHLIAHQHIPDRPPHPVSPVPIPQIPGRPSPTGAHPTANQGPSAIRSTAPTTNGTSASTGEDQQPQALPPYHQQRAGSSRAASAHPQDSGQGQQQGPGSMGTAGMPTEPTLHGAPVRQYLNTKVTGHLLEGMKMLAKEQPKDPLRALGEFLLQRSKQYECGGGGGANGSSTSA
ncbi:hypothetical protein QBC45DRAFT_190281 [Copromyces sp. CBS 386.78]|nr:hypothetical protein QBC45DRAFT_190281 [Copromyces sp. CBS 386.78]